MNETIAILSGMAPKEPEQWAVDEWMDGFEKDYPEPWNPTFNAELADACLAVWLARNEYANMLAYNGNICLGMNLSLGRIPKFNPNDYFGREAWGKFRDERLSEFTINEWPIIWARKRLELVNETSKG